MAGKRQATSNLNHDNWDQEEEPEERGTFRTASQDELKTRVIKKARRKVTGAEADAEDAATPAESKSVFSGFSGFGKPAASSASNASPFAFLAKFPNTPTTGEATKPTFSFMASSNASTSKEDKKATTNASEMFSFGTKKATESTSTTDTKSSASTSIFGNAASAKKDNDAAIQSSPKAPASMFKSSVPAENAILQASNALKSPSEYFNNVAELNFAVLEFLKKHMDKDPYCILTPVFNDYKKHLNELQQQEETTKQSKSTTLPATAKLAKAAPATAAATFSFGKPSSSASVSASSSPLTGITFGKKPNCTITSGGTTSTPSTPVFSFGNTQASTSVTAATTSTSNATATSAGIFSFGTKRSADDKKGDEAAPKPGFFSFGGAKDSAASPPKTNGFSFGLKSDDKPSTSGFMLAKPASGEAKSPVPSFSFTPGSTPFFGNAKPPAADAAKPEADDEDEAPPKAEFKQVVEDDATYSKRCKVFAKKDNDFVERGVGTLYLKPVKDSEKTQMLVRADTNLGNILVNLILSEGLPAQRKGKNNVVMVCVPTPDEAKATTILLRVKTSDEADELLEQIEKHKK